MIIDQLLSRYPLISDQVDQAELRVILQTLEQQIARGECRGIVEFGCYAGTTSLFIRRLLDHHKLEVPFHVYDSFAGLPEKSALDHSVAGDQFRAGELAVTKKDFLMNFKRAALKSPVIHKGWFRDMTMRDLPDEVSFAFLDGDFYESVRDSLRLVTPRLTPDATIVIDDYASESLPGAARAAEEWLIQYPQAAKQTVASLLVINLHR